MLFNSRGMCICGPEKHDLVLKLAQMTFQTIMATGFFEISRDLSLSSEFRSLIDVVDSPANPYMTWWPWLPNMLMIRKMISVARIYLIVRKQINIRKASGVRRNDAVQHMLDDGESTIQILGVRLPAYRQNNILEANAFKVHLRAVTRRCPRDWNNR